jgi:septal ring factor EnvC (AmiA/AmiB activator)
MSAREIAEENAAIERLDRQIKAAFGRLVLKLERQVHALEYMGENDAGLMSYEQAEKFHNATAHLRELYEELGGKS